MLELDGFIGTENHFKIPFSSYVYTDGIKYLIDKAGFYWAISDTAIYLSGIKKTLSGIKEIPNFLIFKIEVSEDNKAVITLREDTNEKPIYKQEYEYTDFKKNTNLKELEFYICNGVFLLKSEY